VSVRGITFGVHLDTTSQVTSNETPPGAAASGTLTVLAPTSTAPLPMSWWMLLAIAAALIAVAANRLRASSV
jgi:hypothetical protein